MDYQHFLLYVRARQSELRDASERARLLRSAQAPRRSAESSPRSRIALALHFLIRHVDFAAPGSTHG